VNTDSIEHLRSKCFATSGILVVCVLFAAGAGCSCETKAELTVGTKPASEAMLLGEIIAQHVERSLGMSVARKFDVPSITLGYQGLMMDEMDVYLEDAAAIVGIVLKESIASDPNVVLERARAEMTRLGRITVLDPLGIEHRFVMVLDGSDPDNRKLTTLTEAAASDRLWTIAQTSEFQNRSDGYPSMMSTYSLRLAVPARVVEGRRVYDGLADGQANMVAGTDTDGQLLDPRYVVLNDDKSAFRPSRVCLLVRQAALDRHGSLSSALEQLSGKFSTELLRKLNHRMMVGMRPAKDVAAEFLRESGL
jgi:glycine betaine/choline ABC-type transport system substrate-binding protein